MVPPAQAQVSRVRASPRTTEVPLSADLVAGAVYQQHLVAYSGQPAKVRRVDPNTGKSYNVNFEYVKALCTGLVTTAKRVLILDASAGTGVGGTAVPVPFLLPGATAAAGVFLADSGWAGIESAKVASIFIRGALQAVATQGLLQMDTNPFVGVGGGVVAPVNNPQLFADARTKLGADLTQAFLDSGKFHIDDDLSKPLNPQISKTLPHYATAYATGLASITAAVVYAGTPGAVTSGVNKGNIV